MCLLKVWFECNCLQRLTGVYGKKLSLKYPKYLLHNTYSAMFAVRVTTVSGSDF